MRASGVYRGVPAEQRRAERRAALMAAGLEVLGTQGRAQMTVRGICREAKLTTRFFYESFADLDELAVAVYDDIVEDTQRRVLAAVVEGTGQREQAHNAISTFVHAVTDDPRRARVLFVEAVADPPLAARRQASLKVMTRVIAEQGRARYHPVPEADTLVDVTAAVLAGGIAELLVAWLRGDVAVSRDQLIEDCVALVLATADSAAAIGTQRLRRGSG